MDKIYYQLKLYKGIPFGTFVNFPAFNLFSTNKLGNAKDKKVISDLEELFQRKVVYLKQIHGTTIETTTITVIDDQKTHEGDGLIVKDNHLGAVFTADCLPIVLADRLGRHVAIVHAGWQGSLQGIALKAVEILKKNGAKEIVAAIGPSANSCCYEVGEDLYKKFARYYPDLTNKVFRINNNHLFLDLNGFNGLILNTVGVRVYQSGICTICGRDHYSYRKNKTDCRQITLAGRKDFS